jgi:hypothetical protein
VLMRQLRYMTDTSPFYRGVSALRQPARSLGRSQSLRLHSGAAARLSCRAAVIVPRGGLPHLQLLASYLHLD